MGSKYNSSLCLKGLESLDSLSLKHAHNFDNRKIQCTLWFVSDCFSLLSNVEYISVAYIPNSTTLFPIETVLSRHESLQDTCRCTVEIMVFSYVSYTFQHQMATLLLL